MKFADEHMIEIDLPGNLVNADFPEGYDLVAYLPEDCPFENGACIRPEEAHKCVPEAKFALIKTGEERAKKFEASFAAGDYEPKVNMAVFKATDQGETA